jgi:hypothetical protein
MTISLCEFASLPGFIPANQGPRPHPRKAVDKALTTTAGDKSPDAKHITTLATRAHILTVTSAHPTHPAPAPSRTWRACQACGVARVLGGGCGRVRQQWAGRDGTDRSSNGLLLIAATFHDTVDIDMATGSHTTGLPPLSQQPTRQL